MYRDNMEELWKKKEKMRKKNNSRLDFSKKKEHPWKDLIGLISRSLTFERNSTQSR